MLRYTNHITSLFLVACVGIAVAVIPRALTSSDGEVAKSSLGMVVDSAVTHSQYSAVALLRDEGELTLGDCSLQQVCVASGLSPDALASAGLGAAETASTLAAVRTIIAQGDMQVQAAQNALATIRSERESLFRLAERGLLSQADSQRLAELEPPFATATNALRSASATLRSSACAGLSAELQTTLEVVASSQPSTPLAVRGLSISGAETVAIRDSLANRRIATRAGRSFDPDADSFALQPTYEQAVNGFSARISPVRDTWINATR